MAEAAATHFLQFRIQYSSIALLYYDYFLTLPAELVHIWRRQPRLNNPNQGQNKSHTSSFLTFRRRWHFSFSFSITTLLYICCRYALMANIVYLLAIANKLGNRYDDLPSTVNTYLKPRIILDISCDAWYKFVGSISVVGRAAVITTFTIRTYAVCAKSRLVLLLLGSIGLACVVLDCIHVPGLRCKGSSSIQIVNNLLSILVPVFEFLCTAFTSYYSFWAMKLKHKGERQNGRKKTLLKTKDSLFYLVLEQGILYFCVISFFTIAAAVLNFRASGWFLQRLLNAFTLPLSGLLTARFILHLRRWDRKRHKNLTRRPDSTLAGTSTSDSASGGTVIERVLTTVVEDFGLDVDGDADDAHGDSTTDEIDEEDELAENGHEAQNGVGGEIEMVSTV